MKFYKPAGTVLSKRHFCSAPGGPNGDYKKTFMNMLPGLGLGFLIGIVGKQVYDTYWKKDSNGYLAKP